MKVAIFGLDSPIGKKKLVDARLKEITKFFRAQKETSIQVEFQDDTHLKTADAILCANAQKLDLILMDLELVEQRLAQNDPAKDLFLRVKEVLEKEEFASVLEFNPEEMAKLVNTSLLTIKPIVSIDPENISDENELIRTVYAQAGRICFFTGGPKESRAWEIRTSTNAQEAAGAIHSDIQRGFIKAEVVGYDDLIESGGFNQAKSAQKVRLEDKDYVVKDGDLITFRFNV